MELTVHLKMERETKGAVRYVETTTRESTTPVEMRDSIVGVLYIRKSALKGAPPMALTLTIKG